ncbi:neuropeptide SIFamide receptor-like [Pollicipes pollicipes]|uniref:neuropeptide SIFamide receptor-like n=1 Tax=Pollicipes pollicipes TaxID=41117 RepID=UPI00188517A2|nr:neuropeptide SIFamide receptor-like [Pollicipes pollicipes]
MFSDFDFASHEYPLEYKPLEFSPESIVKIVAYALVFVGSLVGNISVIVIAATNIHMRSAINAYLVNLAVADICIVLFCMWVHLVVNITHPIFVLGAFWCKFNGFAQGEF